MYYFGLSDVDFDAISTLSTSKKEHFQIFIENVVPNKVLYRNLVVLKNYLFQRISSKHWKLTLQCRLACIWSWFRTDELLDSPLWYISCSWPFPRFDTIIWFYTVQNFRVFTFYFEGSVNFLTFLNCKKIKFKNSTFDKGIRKKLIFLFTFWTLSVSGTFSTSAV